MFKIETLKKLKEESIELNKNLKEINSLVDSQMNDVEGMLDITQRVKKAFTLYKSLVNEMDEEVKKLNILKE